MAKNTDQYLRRLQPYIDRRIKIISDSLDSSNERIQAERSIIYFLIGLDQEHIPLADDASVALEEIIAILNGWDIMLDGDIAGYIYQGLSCKDSKKSKGQFFTPPQIVSYIIKSVLSEKQDTHNLSILDPACGSGQFLITVFKELSEIYKSKGLSADEAAKEIALKNIYGIDIDPIASEIARYNISALSGCPREKINISSSDFLCSENATEGMFCDKTYDVIIGNPPWGSKITAEHKLYFKKNYESAESGVNSFTLFIEKSLRLLSDGGALGFLVPEAYLNINAHQKSRQMILAESCIKEITQWGEQFKNVFAPAISIILKKLSDSEKKNSNIVHIRNQRTLSEGTAVMIPQSSYFSTMHNIFNIHFSQRAETIIDKINEKGSLYLDNNAKFFLGIVTGANAQFLSKQKTELHPDPIVVGKDIGKYKISFSGHHFKFDKDALQQVAPRQFYTTKGKILYKFIGKNLTFALDKTGYYSLNNVNGFIPSSEQCSPEYLVALLNSPLIQYYYEKNFFTVKVLRGNLEKLPLKILPAQDQNKITELSSLASSSTSYGEFENYTDTINDMFFSAYGISDREAARIMHRATDEDPGQGFIFQ